MNLLAAMVTEPDTAELAWLAAWIVAAVLAVVHGMARNTAGVLLAVAVGLTALGLWVA
jgi:hypothetical protein